MIRWISSALITAALFCALLFLRFPEIKSSRREQKTQNTLVSNVTIIKKTRPVKKQTKTAPKPVEKPTPPDAPVPDKSAIPEKAERSTPSDAPEEALDTETEDAPDADAENGDADTVAGAPDSDALASYKAYVLSRIAAKKIYPAGARSRGLEGQVMLELVLQPDGKIKSVRILGSSVSALLEDASLASVRRAAPFKPLPDGLPSLTISWGMQYKLD